MNRYLLLTAAAASVAVTGPLPDLQWQNNNNRLVDFVAESPSALTQDARGLNFPVLDTSWMIAGGPDVLPSINNDQDHKCSEGDLSDSIIQPPLDKKISRSSLQIKRNPDRYLNINEL